VQSPITPPPTITTEPTALLLALVPTSHLQMMLWLSQSAQPLMYVPWTFGCRMWL
jgi:hypothetical protein